MDISQAFRRSDLIRKLAWNEMFGDESQHKTCEPSARAMDPLTWS